MWGSGCPLCDSMLGSAVPSLPGRHLRLLCPPWLQFPWHCWPCLPSLSLSSTLLPPWPCPTLCPCGVGVTERDHQQDGSERETDRWTETERQRMTLPPWYSWAISPCPPPPPPPCPCGSWSCPGPWRAGGRAADETAVVSSIQAHFRNGGEDDVLPPPQLLGAGGLVEGQFHLSSGAWPESLSNGG